MSTPNQAFWDLLNESGKVIETEQSGDQVVQVLHAGKPRYTSFSCPQLAPPIHPLDDPYIHRIGKHWMFWVFLCSVLATSLVKAYFICFSAGVSPDSSVGNVRD